ncbi:hypothetical protein P4233_31215 [Pseudomonas aeruginosa]|nr:hypothetical protein [Pseudomonas aeruginosa]
MLAPAEVVHDPMRPQVIRPTVRGEITWAGQRYFLDSLRNLHGEEVAGVAVTRIPCSRSALLTASCSARPSSTATPATTCPRP